MYFIIFNFLHFKILLLLGHLAKTSRHSAIKRKKEQKESVTKGPTVSPL